MHNSSVISQRTKLILSKLGKNDKTGTTEISGTLVAETSTTFLQRDALEEPRRNTISASSFIQEDSEQDEEKENDMSNNCDSPSYQISSDFSDEDPTYAPSERASENGESSDSDNEGPVLQLPELSSNNTKRKRKVMPKVKEGKLRVRNENEWIDNKSKSDLNKGFEHKNRKGNVIPGKVMKSPCAESCRNKCRRKINEPTRKIIFDEFWNLGDHTRQWDFLVRNVTQQEKKQVTVKNTNSRRNYSRQYKFNLKNEEVKMCKIMFLNTLGISETFVNTALQKVGEGGTVEKDKRGKHSNRPQKNQGSLVTGVVDHIKLHPVVPSHYVRKTSKRMYLEEGLNISIMHRMYLEYAKENKWDAGNLATLRQYRDIFNSKLNISFFKPKKDQCSVCTAYKNTNPENRTEEMEEGYNRHIHNKTEARSLKDADKELSRSDKSVLTACFDLQKVLITPQSEVNDFYYKSKLATYNFTIFNLGNNQGYCYVWHEEISKRGTNEIGSCLWSFLNEVKANGIKKVILYSDNCGGQNRNRFLFSMFANASENLNLDITHRFLEKGHTQNENDSMHAVIEVARKRHSAIYTPHQWISLIKLSKVTSPRYIVKEMSQEDFFSFKPMVEKQNWKKDSSGETVRISQIRDIHFKAKFPNKVFFAYNYGEKYRELDLKRSVRKRETENQSSMLPRLYKELLRIDDKKLKGLLDLCKQNLIPPLYHGFYNSLRPASKIGRLEEILSADVEDSDESD